MTGASSHRFLSDSKKAPEASCPCVHAVIQPGETFSRLDDLIFVKHLDGGSGGVDVFRDTKTGRQMVLKQSTSSEHLKYEVLANTLYARLGFRVPNFAVYRNVPEEMRMKLRLKPPSDKENLFMLAEFIEGESPGSPDKVPASFAEGFVVDALLKNRDLVGNLSNILVHGEEVYRIDNGSVLNFRARGEQLDEKDFLEYVIDLNTLRDSKISQGAKIYGNLTEEQVNQQRLALVRQTPLIMDTLRELCAEDKLNFSEPRKLYDLFAKRIRSLAHDDFSVERDFKEIEAKALQPTTLMQASGIMVHTRVRVKEEKTSNRRKEKVFVLMGQRTGTHHGKWCTLGGGADVTDQTAAETAARETREESNGLIAFSPQQIKFSPFLEQKLSGKIQVYRMYIAPHSYVDPKALTKKLEIATEESGREYLQFAWLSLEDVITAVKNKRDSFEAEIYPTGKMNVVLYPDMFALLFQPEAIKKLESIVAQPDMPVPLESQELISVFTEHFAKQLRVSKELEKRHKENKTESIDNKGDFHSLPRKPLSLIHLESLVGSKGTVANKVDRFIENDAISLQIQFTHFLNSMRKILEADDKDHEQIKSAAKLFIDSPEFGKIIKRYVSDESLSTEQKIQHIEDGFKELFPVDKMYDQNFKKMIITFIEQESEYQEKGYYSFYHAVPHFIGVAYDLFTAFYKILNNIDEETYGRLRLSEIPFRSLPTLQEFMAHFTKIGGGKIDNYSEGYQEMAVSVNPFLLGSHSDPGSASYYLFETNTASSNFRPFEKDGVFDKMLEMMGFTLEERTSFLYDLTEMTETMRKSGGRMCVISAKADILDQVFYPAVGGGRVLDEKADVGEIESENSTDTVTASMRDVLTRVSDGQASVVMRGLQARHYLRPETLEIPGAVLTTFHSRHPLTGSANTAYNEAMNTFANRMVNHMVSQSRFSLVVNSEKQFIKKHRVVSESVLGFGKFDPAALLENILSQHNTHQLVLFLRTWKDIAPALLKEKIKLIQEFKFEEDYALLKQLLTEIPVDRDEFFSPHLAESLYKACQKDTDLMGVSLNARKRIKELFEVLPSTQHRKLVKLFGSHLQEFFDSFEFMELLSKLHPDARLEVVASNEEKFFLWFFIRACKLLTQNEVKFLFKKFMLTLDDFFLRMSEVVNEDFLIPTVELLAEEKPDYINFQCSQLDNDVFNGIFRIYSGNDEKLDFSRFDNEFDKFKIFISTYILTNKNNVSPSLMFRCLINFLDRNYLKAIITDKEKLAEIFMLVPSDTHQFLLNKCGEDFVASLKSQSQPKAGIFFKSVTSLQGADSVVHHEDKGDEKHSVVQAASNINKK